MKTIDYTVLRTTLEAHDSLDPARAVQRRPGRLFIEVAARLCTASLLAVFAWAAFRQWSADPGRITLILLVAAEVMTIGLSLFSRVPVRRDWRPLTFLCSIAASYYFLAVQLAPGTPLVHESVGATLQALGIGWQLFAKASLRRSFGILPANRGIVSHGAYRFMRHPIYFGYFVADIGFLLVNFGLQNLLVYGFQFALQLVRIVREEKLLSDDERYCVYKSRVRFRVVPGFF